MDNTTAVVLLLMTLPAVIGSMVVAAGSKKTNAAWRARRQARAVARASAK